MIPDPILAQLLCCEAFRGRAAILFICLFIFGYNFFSACLRVLQVIRSPDPPRHCSTRTGARVWCGAVHFHPLNDPFRSHLMRPAVGTNSTLAAYSSWENKIGTVLTCDATRLGWVSMDVKQGFQ
jgi:hypothetical protein